MITLGTIFGILYGVAAIGFFIWFLNRHTVKKKPVSSSTKAVGTCVFMDFLNQDQLKAVEHVLYMKEDWEEKDGEGDDVDRFKYLEAIERLDQTAGVHEDTNQTHP